MENNNFLQQLNPQGNAGLPSNLNDMNRPIQNLQSGGNSESFGNILIRGANYKPANISELVAMNGEPLSRSITIQVTSRNAGSGTPVATVVRLFNERENGLNNLVETNGSGAGSITYNYPDGNAGRTISELIKCARQGMGIICVGAALRIRTNGSPNADALAIANARFVTRSMFSGSELSIPFDMSTLQFRPDNDTSIEYVKCVWNLHSTTQFEFLMPPPSESGTSIASATFYFPEN